MIEGAPTFSVCAGSCRGQSGQTLCMHGNTMPLHTQHEHVHLHNRDPIDYQVTTSMCKTLNKKRTNIHSVHTLQHRQSDMECS